MSEADAESAARRALVRRTAPLLVLGMGLVLAGALIGQKGNLAQSLAVDLRGVSVEGDAEKRADGAYALRYTHPSGTIYRTRYTGPFGYQAFEGDRAAVRLVYDAKNPRAFQPAGLSYLPGALALAFFISGMSCVLRARRLTHDLRRAQAAATAVKQHEREERR